VQLTLDLRRHLWTDAVLATAGLHRERRPSHDQSDLARLKIGDMMIPSCRNDLLVPVIYAAVKMQQGALELARRAVLFFRDRWSSSSETVIRVRLACEAEHAIRFGSHLDIEQ
jgi:hypothetical protein